MQLEIAGRRKTASSCTCEECSSWKTAKTWSPIRIWTSSRAWSTRKTCRSTSLEKCCSNRRSSKSFARTWSRSVWSCSKKSLRIRKISRNFMSSLAKTSNWVFTRWIEIFFQEFILYIFLEFTKFLPRLYFFERIFHCKRFHWRNWNYLEEKFVKFFLDWKYFKIIRNEIFWRKFVWKKKLPNNL